MKILVTGSVDLKLMGTSRVHIYWNAEMHENSVHHVSLRRTVGGCGLGGVCGLINLYTSHAKVKPTVKV